MVCDCILGQKKSFDSHVSAFGWCPVGVLGLLFIGGPYVTRGYLNRPAKTAAVIVSRKTTSFYPFIIIIINIFLNTNLMTKKDPILY